MTSSANGLAVDPVQLHAELRDAGNDSNAHLPLGSAPTFFMSEQPLVQVETVFRPLAASPDSGEAREPVIPAISDRPKTDEDSPTVLPEGWKFTGEIEVDGPIDIGGRLDGSGLGQFAVVLALARLGPGGQGHGASGHCGGGKRKLTAFHGV